MRNTPATEYRASFYGEEWADLQQRAGDAFTSLPDSQQTNGNLIRLAFGFEPIRKGGSRIGGFEEGNTHSPRHPKRKRERSKKKA